MPTPPSRWRLGLLAAALLLAVAAFAFAQTRPGFGFQGLKVLDFPQYWAAGQLLAAGESPYDLDRLGPLERHAGRLDDDPLPMLNPPWALPLVMPLGYLSAPAAHAVWLLAQLVVVVVCTEWLWRHFGGPEAGRPLAHLVAWTFVPTSCALLAGQICPVLLLGAVSFLSLVRARRDFAAGAACCLLAVKPHVVYLFWPAVILWAAQHRRGRILLGGALTGLLVTGLALARCPTVLADYWQLLRGKPLGVYESPTWGMVLRYVLGEGAFGWQFASVVPGLVWFAWWWPRRWRQGWDELLPLLLLVSMATSAYGAWRYDLVVLLVAVLQVAAWRPTDRRWAVAAHAAINGLAFYLWQAIESRYIYFIWMAPALLLAYVLLRRPPAAAAAPARSAPPETRPPPAAGRSGTRPRPARAAGRCP